MITESYDIFKSGEKTFQIHSAGKMYKIEFDNENQQKMFEEFISLKKKIL